jgi:hypothetical protein
MLKMSTTSSKTKHPPCSMFHATLRSVWGQCRQQSTQYCVSVFPSFVGYWNKILKKFPRKKSGDHGNRTPRPTGPSPKNSIYVVLAVWAVAPIMLKPSISHLSTLPEAWPISCRKHVLWSEILSVGVSLLFDSSVSGYSLLNASWIAAGDFHGIYCSKMNIRSARKCTIFAFTQLLRN